MLLADLPQIFHSLFVLVWEERGEISQKTGGTWRRVYVICSGWSNYCCPCLRSELFLPDGPVARLCSLAGAGCPPVQGPNLGGARGVSPRGCGFNPCGVQPRFVPPCLASAVETKPSLISPISSKSTPRNHACPPTIHCNRNIAVVPFCFRASDARGNAGARSMGRGPVRRRFGGVAHLFFARRRAFDDLS